jgi:predicted transcriptional regulator
MTEFTHEAGSIDPVQSAKLTAEIVAAYVANHELSRAALSDLIGLVHRALHEIAKPAPPPVEEPSPAVSIRKSIKADYIICLEDGKQFKSLKRHLRSATVLLPSNTAKKWGLLDYPWWRRTTRQRRPAYQKIRLGQMRNKPIPPRPRPRHQATSPQRKSA